jgi:hypothetical protein
MKSTYLKLALPMALATLLVNAEELNFTKNLPIDSKTMPINENLIPAYDNRINVNPGIITYSGGISYARIKPDSTYIGISTVVNPDYIIVTAMGGYNFSLSPKDRLSPAAGLGHYTGFGRFGSSGIFPVVGLEYEHAFNSTFSVGADFASVLIRGGDSSFALGVPFTFHFGDEKKWEFRVMPCLRHKQNWPRSDDQIALSGSLGYRF